MGFFNFTPFPEIETNRLRLRRITTADMNEFYILKSDQRLLKGYGAKPKSYEEACRFLSRLNAETDGNESIVWGMALKESGRLIGSICFWNLSEERRSAEIGYELMHDYQGRGYMSEAAEAVISCGFMSMNLLLIEAFPDPANVKSVRLLEKSGFNRGAEFTETEPGGEPHQRVTYTLSYEGWSGPKA